MEYFRLVLLLAGLMLSYVLYKVKDKDLENKYFIYFTYTTAWILFGLSMIKMPFSVVLRMFFSLIICFYTVLCTVRIFNNSRIMEFVFKKHKDKTGCIIVGLWAVYGISVIFLLKDSFYVVQV